MTRPDKPIFVYAYSYDSEHPRVRFFATEIEAECAAIHDALVNLMEVTGDNDLDSEACRMGMLSLRDFEEMLDELNLLSAAEQDFKWSTYWYGKERYALQ